MSSIKAMIAAAVVAFVAFVCGALYIGFRFLAVIEGSDKAPAGMGTFSFTDVLAAWLTVLSIMVALASLIMTGAAVLIGVAAIIGYQGLKQEAQAHAQLFAAEYLKGKDFDDRIKSSIGTGLKSWRSGTALRRSQDNFAKTLGLLVALSRLNVTQATRYPLAGHALGELWRYSSRVTATKTATQI